MRECHHNQRILLLSILQCCLHLLGCGELDLRWCSVVFIMRAGIRGAGAGHSTATYRYYSVMETTIVHNPGRVNKLQGNKLSQKIMLHKKSWSNTWYSILLGPNFSNKCILAVALLQIEQMGPLGDGKGPRWNGLHNLIPVSLPLICGSVVFIFRMLGVVNTFSRAAKIRNLHWSYHHFRISVDK